MICFALLVLIGVVITAVGAPKLAPHDPAFIDVVRMLKPPLWTAENGDLHVLGTDSLGRDVLSRIIYGARVSLVVGVAVAALVLVMALKRKSKREER